jgi:uncharacterized protein
MILTALLAGAAAGLASAPHCAAMCGPLAMLAGRGRPTAAFHAARVAAYALSGGLAGALGGGLAASLAGPSQVRALLGATVAAGLAFAAWRLWRGSTTRPAPLVQLKRKGTRASALLGASTSCLPCGALFAGLLVAAGMGSPLAGSVAMIAFACASAPGLLLAGWLGRRIGRVSRNGRKALAVLVALGALVASLRAVEAWTAPPSCCHASASR